MKLLLDIKDSKVPFMLELLNSFSFVKSEPLTDEKARLVNGFKESIQEVALSKKGKLKLKSVEDFINEL